MRQRAEYVVDIDRSNYDFSLGPYLEYIVTNNHQQKAKN